MSEGDVDLSPRSRLPQNARERDLLLRRVPEVACLPEFANLGFDLARVSPSEGHHATRIAELADAAYLERLAAALVRLRDRADVEANGGLNFLAASLLYFVTSLAPERHPLVVALYFLSLSLDAPAAERLVVVARRMDEYESQLDPL